MKKISFNENWTFARLSESDAMRPVRIPHDAMLAEPRTALSAGGKNTGWYEGHDYVYEKRFSIDGASLEKVRILEFEGVYRKAEVFLNGEKLCFRPYGYTNFYVDITAHVRAGENILRVIARNADQPNSRWYSGAGIYRPVWLWEAEKAHIEVNGLRVRTLSTDPAVIEVALRTSCEGMAQIDICDGERIVASCQMQGNSTVSIPVPDAALWSGAHPKLYTCRASFHGDSAETTFGIRSLTWGRDGLKMNGERIILNGACIHHDNGILGACCYADSEWRKIRILKESGYNAIRSAHNPCSKALLDACDALGMLVMDEYIDHWYIHKTQYDYVDHFDAWWEQDLTDMVEKDFNHPSVILYSTGNEVSETAQKRGIALTKALTEKLHALDATRPVTCGVNIFFNFLSSIGFGIYSDSKAKQEAQKAEKRARAGKVAKKKSVGSEFFNDLAGILGSDTMKIGAMLPPCDLKTRDAFANMDIAGYNYGINRYTHDLKHYPDRLILGSETFCSDAYRFRELAKKDPRLIGDFVWAGMDYLGEVSIGSWEYRDYAPDFSGGAGWVTAGSGRIDLTGAPLGESYYTRVALEAETGPYIAVCPVNHTHDKHSPSSWKMSNALPSWSWNGCDGNDAHIEVYARASKVALYINGTCVGEKKLKNTCIARFTARYASGTIEAVSFDAQGREIGRYALKSASETTELRAVAEESTARAGHLVHIRLSYTDENGIVKPLSRGILDIHVTGGELLGAGSACPYSALSYLAGKTDTYYGEALAIVRADGTAPVILTATDGENTARATIAISE